MPAGSAPAPRWFPDNEPPTRLLLVRHGSTEHSHDGRFSGRNELPLDDTGRVQAQAIARHVIALSAPQETMFKFHLDTASLSVIDYFEDGTSSVRTITNSEHPDGTN